MVFFCISLFILVFSAFACLFPFKKASPAKLGAAASVLAALAGLMSAGSALYGGAWSVILPWSAPGGELSFGLDALSAFFLAPLFVLSAAAAVYGAAYIKKETPARQGFHFFLYNLLTAAMVLVFSAKNAVLFIAA